MTDQEFIQFLWCTGHFWNSAYPETRNISVENLPSLTLADRVVKLAVKSYQEADVNLVPLSLVFHDRDPIPDGEVGPATLKLAGMRRCGVPDHPPPESTIIHNDVLRAMRMWVEAGRGSWPIPGCDPLRRDVHSIRVGIDTRRAPERVKAYLSDALTASAAAYADIGLSIRYILDESVTPEIHKKFESLAGSVIGWNEFPRPGTCSQTIQGRLDTNFTPEWRLWANLEAHETGHGVGLVHTRGHIMNPSILLVWPLTWRGSPSESTLKRFFGGVPIDVSPSPSPLPDPPGVLFRIIRWLLNLFGK